MKGYLERIAANAARPRATIHPFVGSMFSAARREPVMDAFRRDEDFLVAGGERGSARRDVAVPANDEAAGEVGELRPMAARIGERAPFERFFAREQKDVVAGEWKDGLAGEIRVHGRAEESGRDANAAGVHADRTETRGTASEDSAGEILVAGKHPEFDRSSGPGGSEVTRFLRQALSEKQGPTAGTAARRQGADSVGRAVLPAREPDEIQIHIGRIEVTAVAQAARPAVVPARKATSLDEYLRRRDGRAG